MMISSFYQQGLGPVKSRQDELTNRKYARKPNELTSNNFFRTSDCIENDTTMEDDSFRQESPVNTSKENQSIFFLNLILISLVVVKVSFSCFDQQCLEYQKDEQWKKQNIPDISREFILNFGMKTNYLKSLTKKSKRVPEVPSYQEDFDTLRMDLNDATINRSNTGQRRPKPVDTGKFIPDGITHTVVYTEELMHRIDFSQEEIMDSHINRT
ncbi:hypothetical protein TNCV_2766871 [Trichonephila clavipes]|nr:hypothetical protein TNCV_2766871 [Trichonephila clavipes]